MNKEAQQIIDNLSDESKNPFAGADMVFCYTWEDAIKDGTFVEVTGIAKECGFKIPVAVTRSVYDLCIGFDGIQTNKNITRLLLATLKAIRGSASKDESLLTYQHTFKDEEIEVWASIEGRNTKNPEPVMTIFKPEEY
ncbi:MAG: DUF6573 family protein [Synergistaceae bacterium]